MHEWPQPSRQQRTQHVRELVIDRLAPRQPDQLTAISAAVLDLLQHDQQNGDTADERAPWLAEGVIVPFSIRRLPVDAHTFLVSANFIATDSGRFGLAGERRRRGGER
jgi:hypothetical protein